MCSTALAFDGADASSADGTQQQRFHEGLAVAAHAQSQHCALTRLRLSHMCGASSHDADTPVDTQLFRPFHYARDLAAADAAAEVAVDPMSLEAVRAVVRVCLLPAPPLPLLSYNDGQPRLTFEIMPA